MFLKALILGLTLILLFFAGVSYYERGLALDRLRVRISDLEVRFATEARPLVINKYGRIMIAGVPLIRKKSALSKNPNNFTEVRAE